MARWLKSWSLLFVAGCALIGVWLLPPEGSPFIGLRRDAPVRTADERRAAGLESELREARDLLRQVRWEDSLRPLLRPGELTVGFPPDLGGAAEVIEANARAELAGVEPRVAVGFFVVSREEPGSQLQYYVGEDEAGPWCMALYVHHRRWSGNAETYGRQLVRQTRHESLLGPCLLQARHGPPGPGTRAWLERVGYWFAFQPSSTPGPLVQARRGAFGFFLPGLVGQEVVTVGPREQACLAAKREACALAVLEGEGPLALRGGRRQARRDVFRRGSYDGAFGWFGGSLVSDLEADLGPERFARFWRSDRPVEESFRESAGTDVGSWTMEWARERLGTEPVGPAVGWTHAGLSGLGLLLLAGVGMLGAIRRQLG